MWSPLSPECQGLGIILSPRESSLGDSLSGAQKGERACSRISEVWIQLPVPPVAPCWLTCQILGNQHGAEMSAECKQTFKSMWKINFPWTKLIKPWKYTHSAGNNRKSLSSRRHSQVTDKNEDAFLNTEDLITEDSLLKWKLRSCGWVTKQIWVCQIKKENNEKVASHC